MGEGFKHPKPLAGNATDHMHNIISEQLHNAYTK